MENSIKNILFDLGNVLIKWDPATIFEHALGGDRAKAEWIINNICTLEWHSNQDAGFPIKKAVKNLCAQHPEYAQLIPLYYNNWETSIIGPITGTVDILQSLHNNKRQRIFALTNWSAELFPPDLERYYFLEWFEDIIVSGKLKIRKPNPEIFYHFLKKHHLKAEETLFIDDSLDNIVAAEALGFKTIHFNSPKQLHSTLKKWHIL